MPRKICRGALVVGQRGKNGSILLIRYHNSRRPLSHSRYIAVVITSNISFIIRFLLAFLRRRLLAIVHFNIGIV
jgi:hypothetical protein